MTLAHQADYSFTIYVRKPIERVVGAPKEIGDDGYMSAYINWPSGGGRDLPDGLPNEQTLDKITGRMKSIFDGKDEDIVA